MSLAAQANRERLDGPPPARPAASPHPGDYLRSRPLGDPRRGWLVTLSLTVLAGLVRLWDLGSVSDEGTPVFDGKHYVPQAWQMLRNGGVPDNPGYELVVHPPLGKQLIALGELALGYNPWGWRIAAAIAGTVTVLLVVRIVRRMTRSTLLGAIAGVLLIADGLSHVQSRIGMLDVFLAVLVLGGFGALVVDRDQMRERLAEVVMQGRIGDHDLGPRLGVRWWRLGAGVLLGLACSAKWSGVYFLAAFAVLCVLWDGFARRAAGVRRPWLGTLFRDVGPALWALALVPVVTYLSTYWAWFASETATDRHVVGGPIGQDGLIPFMPDALRALWYYHGQILEFHTGLNTPADPHPYESKPWSWPMSLEPMLYYYQDPKSGCGGDQCVRAVMLIGTPALWWLSVPALGWAAWRTITSADWRYAAVLVAYAAGWLPWFVDLERQMYFFYMAPLAAFLVIGVTLALGDILGRARAGPERRSTGLLVVSLYVGLVVANFVWLWPILNGDPITEARWQSELWLPSWR